MPVVMTAKIGDASPTQNGAPEFLDFAQRLVGPIAGE
jgi:hypothetical protein